MSSEQAPVRALTKGTEIIESYIFGMSTRNFSIYSERLLMRLVALAQMQLAGANFRDGVDIGQVSIGPLGEATVDIPIRSIMGDGNNNYTQAKKAIVELMQSPYFVERPKIKGGKPVYDAEGKLEYEFFGYQILNSCKVNVKPGFAVVEVNRETWRAILDFSKGFRKYDLEMAMNLKLVPSLRLYRLLSNQKNPITYSIDRLRQIWGFDARDKETGEYLKYRDTSSFIKRVIEPAKMELDEKSPWSFTYTCNYSESAEENKGRRGRKSITSVTFFPSQKVSKLNSSELFKKLGAPAVLGHSLYNLLVNKFGFSAAGVNNNILLFESARKSGMDVEQFLYGIAPSALRAQSIQGYVVNALKKQLKEHYGVEVIGGAYILPDKS